MFESMLKIPWIFTYKGLEGRKEEGRAISLCLNFKNFFLNYYKKKQTPK